MPRTDLPASDLPAARRATVRTAGQLALDLEREQDAARAPLPPLELAPEWKDQQRLWGHSLHPMCSYLASFPAALVHAFIARYTRPGDVVLDPFSGRGTTPLQACAEGRIGAGNDLNPFAHLLTAAKIEAPDHAASTLRLTNLRLGYRSGAGAWEKLAERVIAAVDESAGRAVLVPPAGSGAATPPAWPVELAVGSSRGSGGGEPVPAEVVIAFHPRTLAQLLYVRAVLRLDERVDRFLAGAISGILHGKSRSYLSELMPNSFSMAPRYVRAFAAARGFESPERDVFACLAAKLDRLYRQDPPRTPGIALLGDARDAGLRVRAALRERGLPDRARLVVTSPPYLRVVKYGYYNWLRTWFLGFDAAEIDRTLDDAHHRAAYLVFLREVLAGLRPALADDAVVVLVIGDVELDRGRPIRSGIGLADAVWDESARPEGYVVAGIAHDEVLAQRKLTKVWGAEAGRATRNDRILVLATGEAGRRRAVHGAGLPVDWTWPPTRLRAL